MFGIGTDLREPEWRAVVRQLLAQGLLAVEGAFGALVLTDESAAVLGRQRQVMLRREPEPSTRSAPSLRTTVDIAPAALPLFERLRAWRGAAAKEQGVPAYVVFHDATLRQIAMDAPTTLAALSRVNGVGENKLGKYGPQILDIIAEAP